MDERTLSILEAIRLRQEGNPGPPAGRPSSSNPDRPAPAGVALAAGSGSSVDRQAPPRTGARGRAQLLQDIRRTLARPPQGLQAGVLGGEDDRRQFGDKSSGESSSEKSDDPCTDSGIMDLPLSSSDPDFVAHSSSSTDIGNSNNFRRPLANQNNVRQTTRSQGPGDRIEVATNQVELRIRENCKVAIYHVSFEPHIDDKYRRFATVWKLPHPQGLMPIYDGGSCLFYCSSLPDKETVYDVEVKPDEGGEVKKVAVRVKFQRRLNFTDSVETCWLLNLILKRVMDALKLCRWQHSHLDPTQEMRVDDSHLRVWPGYVTSVVRSEDGTLSLRCELRSRVLQDKTALEVMCEAIRVARHFNRSWKQEVVAALKGQVVMTYYNNRTYTVDELDFNSTPLSTFELEEGKEEQ